MGSEPAIANGDHTVDLRLLVVCTGNICRSPAGELLLRHRLSPGSGIRVVSAGTYGVVGHPVEPTMARLLSADGVDPAGFAATRLTESLVAEADLVLTMETGHRSAVVQAHPPALARTFTMREFVHLLGYAVEAGDLAPSLVAATAAERLRSMGARAREVRTRRLAPPCPEPDIADPYRLGDAAYRQAYAAIRDAVDFLVTRATGSQAR